MSSRNQTLSASADLNLVFGMVVAALALALLQTLQAASTYAYRGDWVPWDGLLKAQTIGWLSYAFLALPVLWTVRRWPIAAGSRKYRLPLYVLLGAALALVKEAIFVAIGNLFRPGVFELTRILSEDFSSELLTAWTIIGLLHVAVRWPGKSDVAQQNFAQTGSESAPLQHIQVRTRSGFVLLSVNDVESISSEGNYASISTASGNHLVRQTLSGLSDRLGERFLRVHRTCLVNLDHVTAFKRGAKGDYTLVLRSGRMIVAARSANAAVRTALLI